MNAMTRMAIYGNGGHFSLPCASRAGRFFGYVYKEITLDYSCPKEEEHTWEVCDKYHDTEGNKEGKIICLFWRKKTKGLTYPAIRICPCTGSQRVAWVLFKTGRKYTVKKIKV